MNARRIRLWVLIAAFLVLVVDMMVMGLKIFGNDYEITFEAWLALVCLAVVGVGAVFHIFENKCPHCGKPHLSDGAFCSYCGKRINEETR